MLIQSEVAATAGIANHAPRKVKASALLIVFAKVCEPIVYEAVDVAHHVRTNEV